MKNLIEIKLPDEVLDNMPPDLPGMAKYLAKHFEDVIRAYESKFRQRVSGVMGGPLSKFERAALMDFLIEVALPEELRRALGGGSNGSYPAASIQEAAAK